MLYLSNAFSLNMLPVSPQRIDFYPVNASQARGDIDRAGTFTNAIGHVDTANVVGGLLGLALSAPRPTVTLAAGDALIVAQYSGTRLPAGANSLPAGAAIQFWYVKVL